jgi:hypothetical protein
VSWDYAESLRGKRRTAPWLDCRDRVLFGIIRNSA